MARKRYSQESEANGQENLMPEMSETKTDRRRRPRLILPLDDSGKPDLSRANAEQIAALKETLMEAEPAAPEPINPAVVMFAVNAIANIEAAIVAPKFGLDQGQAAQALQPPEPLRSQIAEAGSRVLSKYSGALGRWQDEIVLAALLVAWQTAAFQNLRMLREMQNSNAPKSESGVPKSESGVPEVMQD